MNRLCGTICSRCRHDLVRPTAAGKKAHVRRHSSKGFGLTGSQSVKPKVIPRSSSLRASPLKNPRDSPPSGPSLKPRGPPFGFSSIPRGPPPSGPYLKPRGSSGPSFKPRAPSGPSFTPRGHSLPAPFLEPRPGAPLPSLSSISLFLGKLIKGWAEAERTSEMLANFGLDQADIKPMLAQFTIAVMDRTVLSTLGYDKEHLQRMADDFAASPHEKPNIHARWLSRLFFEWATTPRGHGILSRVASLSTLSKVTELFYAADLSKPEALYPRTRSAPRRKVIMHVGPTNSGKTHNALRALAAARTGAYAGPLRLLAHEIWERLNKGQIIPAGVDVSKEEVEEDPEINFDVGPQPVIRKDVNKQYARPCNMITGEEQKIVDLNATLISCTVEMLPIGRRFDVAVIDEIQLLSDSDRGGAWTRALLAVNANEIHLCGEETAVPLVQSLLGSTGDEVVVNRYERLTPLRVEEQSLKGDLRKVKAGDCVVAFSRKQVFAMRKRIEQLNGVRCAVAYGRLPPELRSEQAALFNQPNSGYDVLVGTDAIGMGLNLKIKRIILNSVSKFDGVRHAPLSSSQIKQIAGRAGRYGLHGDNDGGFATTLQQPDLAVLRKALAEPFKPLKEARLGLFNPTYETIAKVLPRSSVLTIADVMCYVSKLHPGCELEEVRKHRKLLEFLTEIQGNLTVQDQVILQLAPASASDLATQHALRVAARMYSTDLSVPLMNLLKSANILEEYKDAVRVVTQQEEGADYQGALDALETTHKVIVMYLWLSYRLPVGFMDQEGAFKLRDEVEKVMQDCLERISAVGGSNNNKKHKKPVASGHATYKTKAQVHAQAVRQREQNEPTYMQPAEADKPASATQ